MEKDVVIAEIRRVQQELALLLPETLQSRWSGAVEFEQMLGTSAMKNLPVKFFLMRRHHSRNIAGVYSHELLHSFSSGYTESAYKEFRGYEEGVVEAVARLLRSAITQNLGIQFDRLMNAEIRICDDINDYNRYISALESIRNLLGYREEQQYEFYLWLIAVPLKDRSKALLTAAMQVLRNASFDIREQTLEILFAADEELRQW